LAQDIVNGVVNGSTTEEQRALAQEFYDHTGSDYLNKRLTESPNSFRTEIVDGTEQLFYMEDELNQVFLGYRKIGEEAWTVNQNTADWVVA